MRSRKKAGRNSFSITVNDATPDAIAPDTMLKAAQSPHENGCGEYEECLRQVEICCEQARAAARLKRLGAACGLFATAQSLLKRVIASGGEACGEAYDDARERLKNITSEMATYGELAKSVARPMGAFPINSMRLSDPMPHTSSNSTSARRKPFDESTA